MNRVIFIFFGIVIGLFGSCSKDNTDEKLKEEEDKLAAYMADHPEAVKVTGKEIYVIKTKEQEEGEKVVAGNFILWNHTVKFLETSEIEYNSERSNVIYPGSYVDGGPELVLIQSWPLDEGIKLLKKGELGDIYIPSRYTICDFQTRVWNAEIVDVITDMNKYQEALMYNYLRGVISQEKRSIKVDSVKNVKSTVDNKEYNVMYHIVDQGAGDPIASDATKIDTRTSVAYTIREGISNVRPFAFEQDFSWINSSTKTKEDCVGKILREMHKGGKVIVAMPHILYFGDEPLWNDKKMQIIVPQWSVLIFTITIKS